MGGLMARDRPPDVASLGTRTQDDSFQGPILAYAQKFQTSTAKERYMHVLMYLGN